MGRETPMPHWPRRMQAPLAAAYMGVSVTKFLRMVEAGVYPKGIHDGGNTLWDRNALDRWIDQWAGSEIEDIAPPIP